MALDETEKKDVTANDYSLSCVGAADSYTSSTWQTSTVPYGVFVSGKLAR